MNQVISKKWLADCLMLLTKLPRELDRGITGIGARSWVRVRVRVKTVLASFDHIDELLSRVNL